MKNQSFFIPYKARSPVGLIPGSSAVWFMGSKSVLGGFKKRGENHPGFKPVLTLNMSRYH
jgi:hypothetical protein